MGDFYSGVFVPPNAGTTINPGAACFYGGSLYYFNTGTSGKRPVYVLTGTNAFADIRDSVWTNGLIPADQVGARVESAVPTAPVVQADAIYLFWHDVDWEAVGATRFGGGRWSTHARVHDAAGAPIAGAPMAISAVAIDVSRIILSEIIQPTRMIRWHVLDAADFSPGQPWRARATSRRWDLRSFASSAGLGPELDEVRVFSSSAWYSRSGTVFASGLTENYLVQSFTVAVPHLPSPQPHPRRAVALTTLVQLDQHHLPTVTSFTRTLGWDVTAVRQFEGAAVRRDPGGRVRAWSTGILPDRRILTRVLGTRASYPNLAWGPPEVAFGDAAAGADFTPAPEVLIGPLDDRDPAQQRRDTRFAVFARGGDGIQVQVGTAGHLIKQRVETVPLSALADDQRQTRISVLRGYIDGPCPLPAVNVAADPGKVAGGIEFGHSEAINKTHAVDEVLTIGVKLEGHVTIGVGLAWEVAAKGGVIAGFGTGSSTSASSRQIQNNGVDRKTGRLFPDGTAFLDDIELNREEYLFFPVGQDRPADDAPPFATLYTGFVGTRARAYQVRTTVPGDLESYTAARWNDRMAKAGFGGDYVASQIKAKALRLTDGRSTKKSLTFSWVRNGMTRSDFAWGDSRFTELGWTFETSVYAGVVFKFWDTAEAEFLGGAEFTQTTRDRTDVENRWAVSASFDLGASDAPDGVQAYDFELFFLPADVQWTTELLALLQPPRDGGEAELIAQIDRNSACWKIVCVVNRIRYNHELAALAAHGAPAAHLAALRDAGVTTTGQLYERLGLSHRPEEIDLALQRGEVAEGDRALAAALRDLIEATEYVDPELRKPAR